VHWFKNMTFDVIGKAGFGYDFKCLNETTAEKIDFDLAISGFIDPVAMILGEKALYFPSKKLKSTMAAVKRSNKLVMDVIENRVRLWRENQSYPKGDLLDLILECDQEKKLNPLELRHNIFLFFLAGHETSSGALTSAMFYLGNKPELQEAAFQEILTVLGDDPSAVPNAENLSDFKFISAIVKETLRMNPPANSTTPRVALEDTVLCDFVIPKGTLVNQQLYPAHFQAKFWKNPLDFNPYRFLSDLPWESSDRKNKIFSFGAGPRVCLGEKFAKAEIITTLALIIQNYSWTVAPEFVWKTDLYAITTAPSGGLPIILSRRN